MQDISSGIFQEQLARMHMLCTLEAEEYERGRNLQVLQPSQPQQASAANRIQQSDTVLTAKGSSLQAASAEAGTSTPSKPTGVKASAVAPVAYQQVTPQTKATESAAMDLQRASTSTAMVTPTATAAQVSGQQLQTPAGHQLKLPHELLQDCTQATTYAGPGVGLQVVQTATPQLVQQPVVPAVQLVPPLLLQQTNSAPLMRQVLQKQRQQEATVADKQQSSNSAVRNGKRTGYCLEPDALKRMVERQLQLQREKQQAEQLRKQHEQQQAVIRQQQQQLELLAKQYQQQLDAAAQEQQQQPLPQYQQHQRLQHLQPHRQRSLPRLPHEHKQDTRQRRQQQHVVAPGHVAALERSHLVPISAAAPAAAVTTAAVNPQQQLSMALDSPGGPIALSLPMTTLDQPAPADLHSCKLFGSAQKRLRLSICEDVQGSGLLSPPATADLQQALVSPVLLAGVSRGLETPAVAAISKATAAGAAALGGGMLELESMPTPSKFFAPSPVAAAMPAGTADITQWKAGATTSTPAADAATGSKDTAAAHAGASIPAPAFATPSKFLGSSPIIAEAGIPAAAGTHTAAADSVQDQGPNFLTPSKFFNCSPSSAGKQSGKAVRETPVTPLLFGQPASPWARQSEVQQQRPGLLASSNPLRTARRSSLDAGAQPSSWVPVPAASAVTPASGHVRVGLFCTPPTVAGTRRGGGETSCGGGLDPAAAAAVPVDIDVKAFKRRTHAVPALDAAAPAAKDAAADAAKAAEAPGTRAMGALSAGVGVPLHTPPVQEQQATATPLTQIL